MKVLVDNQLPCALARFLASKGINAFHVADFELDLASDIEIWTYAKENDFIVISKDQDFLNFANKSKDGRFIWVRIGNCRKAFLLKRFVEIWPQIEECFRCGDIVLEIR